MQQLQAYLARAPVPGGAPGSKEALVHMYSDLSGQAHSNSAAFRARVAWWTTTLETVQWDGLQGPGATVMRIDAGMPNRWAMDTIGRPLCIAVVVEDAAVHQRYMRLDEFLARAAPLHAKRALYSTVLVDWVAKPAWRAAARIFVADADEVGDEAVWPRVYGEWVLVPNVERAAALFVASLALDPPSMLESIMTRAEMQRRLQALRDPDAGKRVPISDTDAKVLLRYLERDANILVVDDDVVKLVRPTDAHRGIQESDRGILAVRQMHAQLTAQVDELERRVDSARARIMDALRKKQPEETAKSYLRTKKQLEELLGRRVGALETVSQLLLKLEQAAGDAEILQTYERSSSALQQILADPLLQPDRVDKTMDALAESVSQQESIEDAMRTDHVDDDEIAAELEKLALGEEEAKQTSSMPSAPLHAPEPSKASTAAPKEPTTPDQRTPAFA
ncbi:hypothetical protein MVES1_003860 [Malassezia vespertilionis]|uniref:Snf7p n=1 Tax=Malassezia vespertilionis TaxID=2020962 RepID=A0A2N1J7Q8_9BASI|nr:uncharacterized protein MVES1_003860 [Malassezia vespertilionis]PKI82597.1 hypothetical protein MVES_003417 [Malassezia vespertilionis]WFD08484.1 hypothetical protein MVES1_003860 [Malassezia vespertilionis]